jgi:HEAT repeat protein
MLWTLVMAAWAGVPEDLEIAADTNLPTDLRQAAFGRLAQADATDTLSKLAADKQTPRNQRWIAIRALGPIKDDASRVALLRFLADADAGARMAALGALGDRGDTSLSGYVAARLTDPALLVRAAAVDALGKLKDPATLSDLERALQDPTNHYRGASLWLRREVVEAMGSIGTDAAVPPLARALDDKDLDVASAAVDALEKIAGFSYAEGRTSDQEREAWRRWAGR